MAAALAVGGCGKDEGASGDTKPGDAAELRVVVREKLVAFTTDDPFFTGTPFKVTVKGLEGIHIDETVYMESDGLPAGAEWVGGVLYTDLDVPGRPRAVLDPHRVRQGTEIKLKLDPETEPIVDQPVRLTVTCAGRTGTAEFLLTVKPRPAP
jgi:hypothetical protein